MIRVIVVDDHAVAREGITSVLVNEPNVDVVGQFAAPAAALAAMSRLDPDVVVLDLRFPDANGLEACRLLRARTNRAEVVVLTDLEGDQLALAAYEAGAKAFVQKGSQPSVLRDAVRTAARGQYFIDDERVDSLVEFVRARPGRKSSTPHPELTAAERQIVALIPTGMTNAQIATHLGIGHSTVKSHLSNATRKLGVRGRASLAAWVTSGGLG